MIADITPSALAYLEAYAAAHNSGEVPTGGRGGAAMAAHRALGAWQADGCRVYVAAPETPASDLAGLAARGQADRPAPARSCIPCRHNIGHASWTCPARAMTWAKRAGMGATDTEWPPGAPACPSFRVRA